MLDHGIPVHHPSRSPRHLLPSPGEKKGRKHRDQGMPDATTVREHDPQFGILQRTLTVLPEEDVRQELVVLELAEGIRMDEVSQWAVVIETDHIDEVVKG